MQKLFSKILLPVLFNRNTRWASDKAIQLANKFGCDVHLLHANPAPLPVSSLPEAKMKDLAAYIRSHLNDGLFVTTSIIPSNWQTALKDAVITEHIDLAVIPRSHRKLRNALIRKVNINQLSRQTSCPVMTVPRRFHISQLRNIVVPVKDLLPLNKLKLATYVSLETNGCICLMGCDEKFLIGNQGCLMKAFQLLNGIGSLKVQCAFRDGPDMANSALNYAKDIQAGLIVVNPGQESRLKGWWNRLTGKWLCRESEIPVLTVAP
jgi:nucleotide-binding universal stress UspA family protein